MNRKTQLPLTILGAVAVLAVLFRPYTIVPAGFRAVVFSLTSGVWEKQLGEGFHLLLPVVHRPFLYDVRTQTYSMSRTHWEGEVQGDDSLAALTSDGQTVSVDVSVRFRVDADQVWQLHKEVGPDYVSKILRPEIRSHTRVAVAEFPVIQVYSDERQVIEDRIEEQLRKSVAQAHLKIDEVLLRDIRFSPAFAQAIEEKQIAQQEAQRMEYVLEKSEKEKEQKIIEAQGESQAIELKGQAVAENAKVVQYDYIRKIAPNVHAIVTDGQTLAVPVKSE